MSLKSALCIVAFVVPSLYAAQTLAAEPLVSGASAGALINTKASNSLETLPSSKRSNGLDALVFTAPPRETAAEGQKIYGPLAEHLSKVLGRQMFYRHPGTWGAYRSEMLKGNYDLIFDGPHFVSYRTERLNHNALVKLPGLLDFAVVTRKSEKFKSIAQMGGRSFCTHAPPNLGTLVLLSQFDNPARQPHIVPIDGWDQIYRSVISGRCTGAVIPTANLKKLDKDELVKIIYKTEAMPNQAFSAGPRLSAEEQAKIAATLLSPEAAVPMEKLRAAFKINDPLIAARNSEYAGISAFLHSEWGYY